MVVATESIRSCTAPNQYLPPDKVGIDRGHRSSEPRIKKTSHSYGAIKMYHVIDMSAYSACVQCTFVEASTSPASCFKLTILRAWCETSCPCWCETSMP